MLNWQIARRDRRAARRADRPTDRPTEAAARSFLDTFIIAHFGPCSSLTRISVVVLDGGGCGGCGGLGHGRGKVDHLEGLNGVIKNRDTLLLSPMPQVFLISQMNGGIVWLARRSHILYHVPSTLRLRPRTFYLKFPVDGN